MAIYDCFQFFNEEEILDIRLNILSPFVDYFVIVESIYDHQGNKRELVFNKKKFEKFSHKINYEIPKNVHVEIDKSKQNITVKSFHKDLLGDVCAKIKSFKPVEPYKGKGIYYVGETIMRKEGKTK
jgi:ribosomal protein L25 (general stress protein Ctc)